MTGGNGEAFDLADAASRYAILRQQQRAYDLEEEAEHEQLRKCARELLEVIRA